VVSCPAAHRCVNRISNLVRSLLIKSFTPVKSGQVVPDPAPLCSTRNNPLSTIHSTAQTHRIHAATSRATQTKRKIPACGNEEQVRGGLCGLLAVRGRLRSARSTPQLHDGLQHVTLLRELHARSPTAQKVKSTGKQGMHTEFLCAHLLENV
jgi:hypothetical protein